MRLLLVLSLIVLQHAAPGSTRNMRSPVATRMAASSSDNANQELSDLLLPLLDQLDDHVHEVKKKRLLKITPLQKTKSKKTPLLILASEIPTRNINNKFDFTDATEYLQNNGVNKKFNENQKHTSEERVNYEITRKQRRGQDKHSIESYNDSDEDVNGHLYKLKQYSNKISKSNQRVTSNNQRQAKLHNLNDEEKHFFEDYSDSLENSGEEKQLYHNNRKFKQFLGEFVNNLSFAKNKNQENNKVNEASEEESGYHLEKEREKENVDDTSLELSDESNKVDETREDRKKSVEKNKDNEVTMTSNLNNKDVRVGLKIQDEVNAIKMNHGAVRSQSVELSNEDQERAENYSFEANESKENDRSTDVNNQKKLVLLDKNVAVKTIEKDSSAEDSVQLNEFSDNLSQETSSELGHALGKDRTSDSLSESFEVLKDNLSKLQSSNVFNEDLLNSKTNLNSKAILKELGVNQQKAVDSDAALSKVLNLLNDDLSPNTHNVNSKQRASSSVSEESLEKKDSGVTDSIESVGSVRNVEAVKKGVGAVNNESFEELLEIIDNIDQNQLSRVSAGKCDQVSRVGSEDVKGVHKIYNLSFRFRK